MTINAMGYYDDSLDIYTQVENAYTAAAKALNDDLRQNLYNATKSRNLAFRQINNNANANHALFSGAPAAAKNQYDSSTYIPNIGTMAQEALTKQEENQETWNEYQEYIANLRAQAAELNSAATSLGNSNSGRNTNPTDETGSNGTSENSTTTNGYSKNSTTTNGSSKNEAIAANKANVASKISNTTGGSTLLAFSNPALAFSNPTIKKTKTSQE